MRSATLLAIAAVVPLLVFATGSAVVAYAQRQEQLRAEVVAHARRVSEAVDALLAANLDSARMLAALPALDDPADLDAFAEIARREQDDHPLWLTVLLLDPQGRVTFNVQRPEMRGAAVEPESLRETVETRRPVVGVMTVGANGRLGVPVRAPVIRDGVLRGVVTVVIRPDGVSQTLAATTPPSDWIVTVVDGSGRVVARNQNADRFLGGLASEAARKARAAGDSGAYEGLTLEGVRTMSAFWKSPESGWSVHIGLERGAFEAPLRRSIAFLAAGLLVSLFLAGAFVILLQRDLAVRRRAAQASEQSLRLEALGRLTGGVAHDFNNLLMIIQGNAEILSRRVKDGAVRRQIDAIVEAVNRAGRLTRELLIFARGGSGELSTFGLNEAVEAFLPSLRQAAGPDVEVSADLDPQVGAIRADRVQLELALLNLAVNARDAMPDGGRLRIATRLDSRGAVELVVADNGPGIPDEIAAQVFDPFFTTKPAGVGTGLGLTQVYGFARQAGGSVRLAQEDRRGAAVILTLPIAARAAERSAPLARDERPGAGRLEGLRILVLDDNADVRAVTAQHLREEGADVIEGADAAEGLALFKAEKLDAVVSDIVMPGAQDGLGFAEAICAQQPDFPVLLVSGYSESSAQAGARGFRVLRKPFGAGDLTAAVAAAVRRETAA